MLENRYNLPDRLTSPFLFAATVRFVSTSVPDPDVDTG